MLRTAVLPSATWKRMGVLAALAIVVFACSLMTGSSGIGLARTLHALAGTPDEQVRSVLLQVRLPRLLAGFGVGALLALTGVLLQALFRNPLADPYVLGVSGGAAVGALCALLAGWAAFAVQGSAVAGGFVAVAIVYFLARGAGTARLLLTGVVVASACGALVSVLLSLATSLEVRGMVFWLAGDLGWALEPRASIAAAVLAVLVAVVVARPLNVLASGEVRARTVGLELQSWRLLLFAVCAVLTAIAVVSAGTVGFVGLITPHAVRLSFKTSDHRIVAPAAALAGGTMLAAADLLARTVVAPRQLPVGAIMALIGAPVFLFLLRARNRNAH
jgi:iron complex transport system permease protein